MKFNPWTEMEEAVAASNGLMYLLAQAMSHPECGAITDAACISGIGILAARTGDQLDEAFKALFAAERRTQKVPA